MKSSWYRVLQSVILTRLITANITKLFKLASFWDQLPPPQHQIEDRTWIRTCENSLQSNSWSATSKVISIMINDSNQRIQVHVLQQSYCCFCLEDSILIIAVHTCEGSSSHPVCFAWVILQCKQEAPWKGIIKMQICMLVVCTGKGC